jgi:hypothetical protein
MRFNKVLVLLTITAFELAIVQNLQAAISVDGNLGDWGITVGGGPYGSGHLNYTGYNYTYHPSLTPPETIGKKGLATIDGRTVSYHLEDSCDTSNSYQVGPLYGGQNYDAEALLVSVVGFDLYVAIATGQRSDNGFDTFAPGDIRITNASQTKTWGIEVGGGAGWSSSHGSHPTKVVGGDNGTTYTLDSNGFTTNTSTPQKSTQKAGSIWDGGTWTSGISGSNNIKTQLKSGNTRLTTLSAANYIYNFDAAFGQHAFIELCIPNFQSLFNDTLIDATISWAPACGNDYLCLSVELPPPTENTAPEPSAVIVWAVLGLTAAWAARKKWRSGQKTE